jgi:hypothetical protein
VGVFRFLGYETCDSREYEPGFEKIAIYVKESSGEHVARQLSSGLWTSKCGDYEDITHTLDALENSDYGTVAVLMKRALR